MTTSLWWLVVLSVLVLLIGGGAFYSRFRKEQQYRRETTCIICGTQHFSKEALIECSTCQQRFCKNNVEVTESGGTSSISVVQVNPARLNPEFPCGSYIPARASRRRQDSGYYCKIHAPRFTYSHRIVRIERGFRDHNL